MCSVQVEELRLEKHGYVPYDLGIGGGDCIRLTIDTDTGQIEGWKKLSKAKLTKKLVKR